MLHIRNNSESMCKRRIGYNADDVVPFMGMDEHQNSGGEGGWSKELDQAG